MTRTEDVPDGSEPRTDGGTGPRPDGGRAEASPLDALGETSDAEVEHARRKKLYNLYRYYVYTPVSVLWHDWRARVGLSLLVFYFGMGLFGPMVVDETGVMDGQPLLGPFNPNYTHYPFGIGEVSLGVWTYTGIWEFPLGTDNTGSDLLSLTVYSTVPILKMMVAGGLFTVVTGTVFGTVSGYKGGIVDTVLSTVTDIFINLPGLPLVIVLAAIFSPESPWAIGILLSVAAWAGLARSIRSQVLTLRQESFVEASRALGLPTRTIVFKDIIPHLMPFVVINLTNAGRRVIFEAVALYYLGILPFQNLNWGSVLNLAYSAQAHTRPAALHWFLVPMVAIVLISIGLILLGQSLDRVFNPRVRARHEKTTSDDQLDEGDGVSVGETGGL